MSCTRRSAAVLLLMALAICASLALAADKKHKQKAASVPQMDEDKRVVHALNRFTFGAQPGDVERVRKMGVDKWIEQQLHPEKIDDSGLEARLAQFPTLKMSTREMLEKFPTNPQIKAVAEGRASMPTDPTERAIYESELARYRNRQQLQKQDQNEDMQNADMPAEGASKKRPLSDAETEARIYAVADAEHLMTLPPDKRMAEILKLDPEERRIISKGLKPEQRDQLFEGLTPEQRETLMALQAGPQLVPLELSQAKIMRATYSQRQLDEVMTDFWFNHFNIFIGKGPDRYMITEYERDVIRPHALGKFKDLLVATAKSPAMMFYLDNWLSIGPDSDFAKNGPGQRPMRRRGFGQNRRFGNAGFGQQGKGQNKQKQNQKLRTGLNENYARELMELHTLGVNGGYTQKDVTEVAKVFTGWGIKQPQKGGDFDYNDRMHEPGSKYVLGQEIKQDGENEGMKVLDILAHQPSTAKFVSTKLAMRFVSDNPPATLVDAMAETFRKSDGDIREVLRTMYQSPEFWAPENYRAKVKTPLEFVVSALRASDADVKDALPIVQTLNKMGMPLYGMQPPTGYSMKAETWVNSAALLSRMNFGLALGAGRVKGSKADPAQVIGNVPPDAEQALAAAENAVLAGDISKQTHDSIRKQLSDPQVTGRVLDDPARGPNLGIITGLIFGSPEFQRR